MEGRFVGNGWVSCWEAREWGYGFMLTRQNTLVFVDTGFDVLFGDWGGSIVNIEVGDDVLLVGSMPPLKFDNMKL